MSVLVKIVTIESEGRRRKAKEGEGRRRNVIENERM